MINQIETTMINDIFTKSTGIIRKFFHLCFIYIIPILFFMNFSIIIVATLIMILLDSLTNISVFYEIMHLQNTVMLRPLTTFTKIIFIVSVIRNWQLNRSKTFYNNITSTVFIIVQYFITTTVEKEDLAYIFSSLVQRTIFKNCLV